MRASRILQTGLVLLAAAAAAAGGWQDGHAEARLDYRGAVLTGRAVQSLARRALQAPRDSVERARLAERLKALLEDDGYLDAQVGVRLHAARADAATLWVRIDEGPRYVFDEVRVETALNDTSGIVDAFMLEAGGVASPRAVGVAVEQALREVADEGYAYARMGVSAWDADSGRVRVRLNAVPGPRVTITRARVEGLVVTRADVAARAMGPLVGLPYRRASAESARQRLEQLGLFRSVTYEGLRGESDWQRGHLVYRVEEPRYNQFDGVVGVQGDAGTVGHARLELGNVLGTGRQLGLLWRSRGRGLVDLSARYVEPLLFGLPLSLRGGLEQQVQDTLYVRTRWGGRLSWALSGRERIEAGFEQERVVQEAGEVEKADIQYTVFGFERTALDRPIGPRRGTRARIDAAQIFKRERLRPDGSRTAGASAVEFGGELHRPSGAATGVTIELGAAGRFSSQRILPVYERYPVGGASSLRGFDEEAFRVDRYALTRLEWRWFLGGGAQRIFTFWDHAWMAAREPTPGGGDRLDVRHRDGYGFGLRVESPGGVIGIDYGLASGRPPLEGKIHLQLISTF